MPARRPFLAVLLPAVPHVPLPGLGGRMAGLASWGLLVGLAETASVAALFLLGLALASGGALPPGPFDDGVQAVADVLTFEPLLLLAGALVLAALVRALVSLEYERRLGRLHHDVATAGFDELFPGYFAMDYGRFSARNSADRVVHLAHDIDRGAVAVVAWVRAVSLGLALLLLGGLLVLVDWRAALLGGIAAAALTVGVLPLMRSTGRTAEARRPAHADLTIAVSEPLRAYRDLVTSRLWLRFQVRAKADLRRFLGLSRRLTLLQAATPHALELGVAVAVFASIALAAAIGGASAATPVLILLVAGAYRFLPTLQRLLHSLNTYRVHRPSLDAIAVELDEVRRHRHPPEPPQGEPLAGELFALQGVRFAHAGGEPVLRGVDLRLRTGQRIGIVGPSGAGKTTLVDLLLGLLRPSTGILRRGVGPAGRPLRVAYLPQQPAFVQGVVLDNLALAEGETVAAAEARRLLDLVGLESLPLDQVLGEGGHGLSGGERQRLGLARALHGDPDVLVLDEPTANLDTGTELEVVQALNRLDGVAMVVVTHREAPLALCDVVYRLEDGVLVRQPHGPTPDAADTAMRRSVAGPRPARPPAPQPVAPSPSSAPGSAIPLAAGHDSGQTASHPAFSTGISAPAPTPSYTGGGHGAVLGDAAP